MPSRAARIHWSDDDRRFGPFIYSRSERGYRPLAMVLSSGDDDEDPICRLRVSGFGHTLILALPSIIRPWQRKVYPTEGWDAETVRRLGRDWYWETWRRDYGFSCSEGFLQVFLGRQTHSSDTTQDWCKFLPWTQWRAVRHSMYGLNAEHFWSERQGGPYPMERFERLRVAQDSCPARTFTFYDYDGELLTARTRIEEREWRFGEGWFRWLSLFRQPKVRRSLDIRFSGETGREKGSWKGGTIGTGIDMLPGELHEPAFRRYCAEHRMSFVGEVESRL